MNRDEYLSSLKASRPQNEALAEGMRPLDEGTQGLIEGQMAKGMGYDNTNYTEGVGNDYGLIGKSSPSMGMNHPDDFYDVMDSRGRDAVAGTVSRIQANDNFTAPLRQAKQAGNAASNFAKTENLRFNNWTLKNTQHLQKLQIEQAAGAARKGTLGAILGIAGTVVGAAVGGAAGFVGTGFNPAGAVAGAGLGMGIGSGLGQAAG